MSSIRYTYTSTVVVVKTAVVVYLCMVLLSVSFELQRYVTLQIVQTIAINSNIIDSSIRLLLHSSLL